MFPTFISILDIQSWWEVPSIAHFCSLFRSAFNLLDFDIEDLEEALLNDGTEENSWLQELIVKLLSGCIPSNEISTFNYQMFLRRLFRQKCQEHDRYNPFNTDIDFTSLPLKTKVDILHALCDFRLDADDVEVQLKNLEADSLRVEPLGYDSNESAYWYFYGTRLYREDYKIKNNKKKSIWQVICFTEDDWFQLTKKFKNSSSKSERALHRTLSQNFLPELPRLFKEKERQARRRLLENQNRRASLGSRTELDHQLPVETATQPVEKIKEEEPKSKKESERKYKDREHSVKEKESKDKDHHHKDLPKDKDRDKAHRESKENKSHKDKEVREKEKDKTRSKTETNKQTEDFDSDESRHEMAGNKKKSKGRRRKNSESSFSSEESSPKRKKTKHFEKVKNEDTSSKSSSTSSKPTLGRQTNNSLSSADALLIFQSTTSSPPATASGSKKKLKSSEVFQQTDEDLQVGMHKILDFVMNHEDAWPFLDPVEEEYAPNYYSVIRKPMDLQTMEDRLDVGHYKHFAKFRSDFQLIVDNCRLYNGAENEYTKMVDNLANVFEKAVDKYLDRLSSSDEEIAVENLLYDSDSKTGKISKKKKEVVNERSSNRGKKPSTIEQSKRRDRSVSEESQHSSEEEKPTKTKKVQKEFDKEKDLKKEKEKSELESKPEKKKVGRPPKNKDKINRDEERDDDKQREKENKISKKDKQKKEDKDSRKDKKDKDKIKEGKSGSKKDKKASKKDKLEEDKKKKEPKTLEKDSKTKVKRGRKKKRQNTISSSSSNRSFTPSPVRTDSLPPSWPPSPPSPDERFDFSPQSPQGKRRITDNFMDDLEDSNKQKTTHKWDEVFGSDEPPPSPPSFPKDELEDNFVYTPMPFSPKPKDKHNKLRETIEKLKAKSEAAKLSYDFKLDEHLKENMDKNKKMDKEERSKDRKKDKSGHHKSKKEFDDNKGSQCDFDKKPAKKPMPTQHPLMMPKPPKPQSNFDALSIATEQTLKDINKWLDDTPNFSSASNSPAYLGLDDFDLLGVSTKVEPKKIEKPLAPLAPPIVRKDTPSGLPIPAPSVPVPVLSKEATKKKPFRDPAKFFNKKREIQRTIDRLQPGKGKGNLITSVKDSGKTDEIFPLGPLSKMKEAKNSLLVKTDTNAPKLSLGSVLNSFGKHRFIQDEVKKDEEEKVTKEDPKPETKEEVKIAENSEPVEKVTTPNEEKKEDTTKTESSVKETKPAEDASTGGPTPNLSAWFKAFGAPKPLSTQKKEDKKDEEGGKSERVPPPDPSPSLDSPQPLGRQRRMSTGSSMSERSSFSQDLDSPRVGMDERGSYPAPYPSPLHRSPSGASPVMASPRPDISPRSAAYSAFNGQMRVGFYQDTVSNKSSPDKSCSPRDNPQSPVGQLPPEHVYAPNTTQNAIYSYANSPFYSHSANYSSTNPTPPYNTNASSPAYYDTSKEQFPKVNYSANLPASSPATQPMHSPHAPILHPQLSPSVHSQHSPSVHSQHSPSVHSQHSPSVHSQHSPSVHSQHSPSVHSQHSPSVHSQHSPSVHSQHSPSVHSQHSPSIHSQLSPSVHSQHSPTVHSPNVLSPHPQNSPLNPPSVEAFNIGEDSGSSVTEKNNAGSSFPVKKRGYDHEQQDQFDDLRNEIVNRNLQMGHQVSMITSKPQELTKPTNSLTQHYQQPLAFNKPSRSPLSTPSPILQPQPSSQNQNQPQGTQQSMQLTTHQQVAHQQQRNQQQMAHQNNANLAHQTNQNLAHQASQNVAHHPLQNKTIAHQSSNVHQQSNGVHHQQAAHQNLAHQNLAHQQALAHQQSMAHQQSLAHQQALAAHQQQAQHSAAQHLKQQALLQKQQQQQQQQQQRGQSQQQPSQNQQQHAQMHQQSAQGQQQSFGQESQSSQPQQLSRNPLSRNINFPLPAAHSASNPYSGFGSESAYPLNIPSTRSLPQQQSNLDLSKFTNMGYSGPEVNYSRALQQQFGRPELSYTRTTVQSAVSQASQNTSSVQTSTTTGTSPSLTSTFSKQMSNTQQSRNNYSSKSSVDSLAEKLAADRLAAQGQSHTDVVPGGYKSDSISTCRSNHVTPHSSSHSTSELEQSLQNLSRNISSMSHIVDRYGNQERIMAELQSSASQYYSDKGLGSAHSIFNKSMSSTSQLFNQGNMDAFNQQMQQATTAASMYNRQLSDLQSQQNELKNSLQAQAAQAATQAAQDRKREREREREKKKKSSSKSATAAVTTQDGQQSVSGTGASSSTSNSQGFQSYTGHKGATNPSNSSLEPSAISLKTSSVVPGSAFNFGPTVGLGTGLYGDKDAFPNFLEEFRSAPNYYMAAAAAAHHRSTPEASSKSSAGTQSSNPAAQSYPAAFLNAAHQANRAASAYQLGTPFIPPAAQAQLMDTSSQFYQHYLQQAGVLNQSLLGTGAYPPGYHPLSMRQPFDSRSPWL